MKTELNIHERLINRAWDILLPLIADRVGPEYFELAYLTHALERDELDASQIKRLLELVAEFIL